MDFNAILGSLSEMLGGVNFSELLSAFMETMKQVIEMVKPLLSSRTSSTPEETPAE